MLCGGCGKRQRHCAVRLMLLVACRILVTSAWDAEATIGKKPEMRRLGGLHGLIAQLVGNMQCQPVAKDERLYKVHRTRLQVLQCEKQDWRLVPSRARQGMQKKAKQPRHAYQAAACRAAQCAGQTAPSL